ncbi:hypothetical protein [Streptomyces sp. KS 21]|uniref:hypothetical protein n=1 Tax=Streptomyces sp. KS 21 TaxID=2485150 RepID=UPI001063446C|nr:hypothetical protein [Streptomyces sp. KS 21]TDU67970.1 hypothetical protein EDD91_8032 [Streptomyces sp. KS 21]
MEDKDERQHLQALAELLEHGRQFEDLTTADPSAGPWKPAAGSDLEADDAAVAPYHLSHAAWLALTVAGDHLHALRTSVLSEESAGRVTATLHTHAQASLARGVIENAARAVWLLASDDRLIRIQRRLALQKKDIGSSTKLHDLLGGKTPRTKEAREEELRQLTLRAGTPPDRVKAILKAPDYTEIVREAGDHMGPHGKMAVALWSGCSSLAHGDLSGALIFLAREAISQDENVMLARITGSFGMLRHCTAVGVAFLGRGSALYRSRAGAPASS